MARRPDREPLYEAAQLFKERCLRTAVSFLWPDERAWTFENIERLEVSLRDSPVEPGQAFHETWRRRLSAEPEDVGRMAADLVAFFYLFPGDVSRQLKLKRVKTFVDSDLASESPDLTFLEEAYASSAGTSGHILIRVKEQMAFFIAFAKGIRFGRAYVGHVGSCKSLAYTLSKAIPGSAAGSNALLYLLFPDEFENILSQCHKKEVARAFRTLGGNTKDLDERLQNIRRWLGEVYGPAFDFYDPEIRLLWDKNAHAEPLNPKPEPPGPTDDSLEKPSSQVAGSESPSARRAIEGS